MLEVFILDFLLHFSSLKLMDLTLSQHFLIQDPHLKASIGKLHNFSQVLDRNIRIDDLQQPAGTESSSPRTHLSYHG